MIIYTEEEVKKEKTISVLMCAGMTILIIFMFCLMLFGFQRYDTTFFMSECTDHLKGSVHSIDEGGGFHECREGYLNCGYYCVLQNGTSINFYDMSYTINATR